MRPQKGICVFYDQYTKNTSTYLEETNEKFCRNIQFENPGDGGGDCGSRWDPVYNSPQQFDRGRARRQI